VICIVKLTQDSTSPADAITTWIIAADPTQAQWQVRTGDEALAAALFRMEVSPTPGKYHLCDNADGSEYWALVTA
jgi:hypothetical protein